MTRVSSAIPTLQKDTAWVLHVRHEKTHPESQRAGARIQLGSWVSELAPTFRSLCGTSLCTGTLEQHPGSTRDVLIAHFPIRCDDRTCLHTRPNIPGGKGQIALVKNHCGKKKKKNHCGLSAARELILNCSESPDPVLAIHSESPNLCVRYEQPNVPLTWVTCHALPPRPCAKPSHHLSIWVSQDLLSLTAPSLRSV